MPPSSAASESGAVPGVDAVGLRAEDRVHVGEVQALDVVVLGVGHHRDAVEGDLELDVLDAGLLAGLSLLVLDRAGGIGDVGLAAAEQLEAVTGAGPVDGDLNAGVRPLKSSATTVEIGSTVDEPEMTMEPDTPVSPAAPELPSSPLPHAVATSARANTAALARQKVRDRAIRILLEVSIRTRC